MACGLTSNQRCARLKRGHSESVDDVADSPMPVGCTEFIVQNGESDVDNARIEDLRAIESGEPPAHRHDQPPQEFGLGESDALGRDGPLALVQLVFLGVHGLVGEVELEGVEPDPEDDAGVPGSVLLVQRKSSSIQLSNDLEKYRTNGCHRPG